MNLPTQITILRIILTPVFLAFLIADGFTYKLISLFIFIIASLTDRYDGYLARKLNVVSKWGAYLDPLADKILVSAAFLAFSILGYIDLWIVLVIIIRDFLITGLRSYAIHKGKPVVTSQLARIKTFVQMFSVYVVYVFFIFHHLAIEHELQFTIIDFLNKIQLIYWLMLIVAFLTTYTGIKYFIDNRDHLVSILKSFKDTFTQSDS